MNINDKLSNIPGRYWAYSALLLWGSLVFFFLLQKTSYGVDEGAARALLLVWSVADRVVTPVVELGVPDFRAIFYTPVGILWTGNVLAARISSILIMAAAAWITYSWRDRSGESESALLASGLLLISPLVVDQIDALSVAPFLLFCFASGAWLNQLYREEPRAFGGLYFSQIFLCIVSTTLHPIGLAYPAVLAWSWYRQPLNRDQQKYFLGGIASATLLALLLTLGWHHVNWFTNPVRSLSSTIMGTSSVEGDLTGIRGAIGSGILLMLLLVVWREALGLWNDFLGQTLLVGLVLGLPIGDEAWSVLVLSICLYWGFSLLLRGANGSGNFMKQRGIALGALFIFSILFMFSDKMRYQQLQNGFLSPRDTLIRTLVEDTDVSKQSDVSGTVKSTRVASQWPGRTMLACRCDTLPLPPPVKDEQTLLTMLRGINYLVFDPKDVGNQSLARNLAVLGGERAETIVIQDAGVIVQMRDANSQNDSSVILK